MEAEGEELWTWADGAMVAVGASTGVDSAQLVSARETPKRTVITKVMFEGWCLFIILITGARDGPPVIGGADWGVFGSCFNTMLGDGPNIHKKQLVQWWRILYGGAHASPGEAETVLTSQLGLG